jgi:hypothetical protein
MLKRLKLFSIPIIYKMTTPPQTPIELTLTLKPSFISDKTFIEQIPSHYVNQLIQSNCLLDKWDMSNYSQKYASQNYINERAQLASYLLNYKKKLNGFSVKYKKALHKWGRVFPVRSLGLTSFAKKTRNTLIKESYYDFDLKNAQPEILKGLCVSNNIQCDIIEEYCNNRESIIADIITASNNTCTRAQVKSLMIRLSFFGKFDGWLKEEGITDFPEPVIVKKYTNQVSEIASKFIQLNPAMYKTITKVKKDKSEKNVEGAFLSTYLQEYELRIVENVLEHICRNTPICTSDIPNHFIATYEFDGLKLLKSAVDKYGGTDLVLSLFNKLNNDLGFSIQWELKDMDKFYNIIFTAPPIDESKSIKERLEMEKQELAKQYIKEKDESFCSMKVDFEKTHFKIISLGVYFEITYNKKTKERLVITRSTKQLIESFQHMSHASHHTSGEPLSFIHTWIKCPDIRAYQFADVYPNNAECPEDTFNLWNPFVMEMYEDEYEKDIEGCEFLLNHIKVLCNHDEIVYNYFITWLAHLINHPEQKSTCPVFISNEGAGKGSFIDLLSKLLGDSKVLTSPQPDRDIWGPFNSLMCNAYFIALDELSKTLTTKANEIIKNLITAPKITINNKGATPFTIKSFHKFFMMTNNKDGGIITKRDDRRKFMVRCSDELISNKEYFDEFYERIENIDTLRTFYDYIRGVDSPVKLPSPPSNEYQDDLKEMNQNPVEIWVNDKASDIMLGLSGFSKEQWPEYIPENCLLDDNDNVIYSGISSVVIKDFISWRDKNHFVYEVNSVKLGCQLKQLNNPHITKIHTKYGSKISMNLTLIHNSQNQGW